MSGPPDAASTAPVEEVLTEARRLGFLGNAPIGLAIEHAFGFASGVEKAPARWVDLGSGGGLPGLLLAAVWADAAAILVEANLRRARFLGNVVSRLGYGDRVTVLKERAEVSARRDGLRGRCDLVVARGFGSPAVTAECGAGFLCEGGRLIVSEPPEEAGEDRLRWPPGPLAQLGLVVGPRWMTRFHYQALIQAELCPDRYPRRVGVPAKRPLY